MHRVFAAAIVACLVVWSGASAAPVPDKAKCDAARKTVAEKKAAFQAAWDKFVKASKDLDKAEKYEADAEKALDRNAQAQAGARQDITNFTNQYNDCRSRHPESPCSTEQGRIKNAEERLQKLKDKVPELQLDLAEGKELVERAENANAAAHAEANAAKIALEKAEKDAAEACKVKA